MQEENILYSLGLSNISPWLFVIQNIQHDHQQLLVKHLSSSTEKLSGNKGFNDYNK